MSCGRTAEMPLALGKQQIGAEGIPHIHIFKIYIQSMSLKRIISQFSDIRSVELSHSEHKKRPTGSG